MTLYLTPIKVLIYTVTASAYHPVAVASLMTQPAAAVAPRAQ